MASFDQSRRGISVNKYILNNLILWYFSLTAYIRGSVQKAHLTQTESFSLFNVAHQFYTSCPELWVKQRAWESCALCSDRLIVAGRVSEVSLLCVFKDSNPSSAAKISNFSWLNHNLGTKQLWEEATRRLLAVSRNSDCVHVTSTLS